MKTIEEKAKAYDEAIEAARCIYNNMREGYNFGGMEDLETIFPELEESKESEDERIRKELLKEVDLEKEIASQYEQNYEEYLTYEEFADIAKYFFELGLKAQKGE